MISTTTFILPGLHVPTAIALRIRAAVELQAYAGGVTDLVNPTVNTSGVPTTDNSRLSLSCNDPSWSYWLNYGSASTNYSVPLDFYLWVPVYMDSTLTLTLEQTDTALHKLDQGGGVVVVPGMTAFDGEYAQLNFLNELNELNLPITELLGGAARGWIFDGFNEFVVEEGAER